MEAVHRYEGTVNQVMGDGIMALFGAPLAHEYIQDGAPEGASSPLTAALPMRQTKKKTGWVYSEPYSEAKTDTTRRRQDQEDRTCIREPRSTAAGSVPA